MDENKGEEWRIERKGRMNEIKGEEWRIEEEIREENKCEGNEKREWMTSRQEKGEGWKRMERREMEKGKDMKGWEDKEREWK